MRIHLTLISLFLISHFSTFAQGFKTVPIEKSNINFVNRIIENEELNGLTYLYLYNGGGVAVGDINNDGLEDLYFTGNQVEDKLYINKGNLKFKDVTKKYFGNKLSNTFHTGVTMVDINNDGWLDIYVSVAGPSYVGEERANLLYINNKGKGFTEQAKEFGLADTLNTTQTVFFDYDLDGDLDCYMLNHVKLNTNIQVTFPTIKSNHNIQGDDHFYVNKNGHYIEKSKEIGIESTRYGLGVVVADVNNDGYPDVYVTNDFNYPDKLFINQKNGTYKEKIKELTGHCSVYAMGVDAADINNDGLIDIMSVDMASEDHVRSKKNMGAMSTKNFWGQISQGIHYQYMFNSLQLNVGNGYFSEISQMAGVAKTDWSWAPLLADFDNDGFQDLFISNGYYCDIRDNDFKNKLDNEIRYNDKKITFEEVKKILPNSKLENYIYKNNGDLTFKKMNFEWGMSDPLNVNGAVYSDLDNDGDLDLILNSTDETALIMENLSVNTNYLDVKLCGLPNNINCIGSKVVIKYNSTQQYRELQTVKGFQSSVTNKLHFGTGDVITIDSVIVTWNANYQTVLVDVPVNQILKLNFNKCGKTEMITKQINIPIFTETIVKGLSEYQHQDFMVDDFKTEVLLPHKMSELGPFITVGDLNGDGLDDVFVGGSRAYQAELFYQNKAGEFDKIEVEAFKKDKNFEDMQAVFIDFDNDGDKDIYVVSGSNESVVGHQSLKDRLYENNNGIFTKTINVLPDVRVSGQKVIAKDINNDGWMDLTVFGRQVPGAYPKAPKSTVLLNNEGVFEDVTQKMIPELEYIGMVTDAIYSDIDEDGDDDLIVVGEWMSVSVFVNQDNVFSNKTGEYNLTQSVGWWSAISEIEQNGKKKYILGNIGKNTKFHPSKEKPFQIYMNDFDRNGTNDIVLAKYQGNICYPVRGRGCSSTQMPFIKNKFPTYDGFATANLTSIYSQNQLDSSIHYIATMFEHSVLEFNAKIASLKPLENQTQLGVVNSIVNIDINNDKADDIVLLGNKFETEVETTRYDSNYGSTLLNKKTFEYVQNLNSGLYLNENIKSAKKITINNKLHIISIANNGKFKIVKLNK